MVAVVRNALVQPISPLAFPGLGHSLNMPHPDREHLLCVMSGGMHAKQLLSSGCIHLCPCILREMVDATFTIDACCDPVCEPGAVTLKPNTARCGTGAAPSGTAAAAGAGVEVDTAPKCVNVPTKADRFCTATPVDLTPSGLFFDAGWLLVWHYTYTAEATGQLEHGCIARVTTAANGEGGVGVEWVEGKRPAAKSGPLAVFAAFREVDFTVEDTWDGSGSGGGSGGGHVVVDGDVGASMGVPTVLLFDESPRRRCWVRVRGPVGEFCFAEPGHGVPEAVPADDAWTAFHSAGTWTLRRANV